MNEDERSWEQIKEWNIGSCKAVCLIRAEILSANLYHLLKKKEKRHSWKSWHRLTFE